MEDISILPEKSRLFEKLDQVLAIFTNPADYLEGLNNKPRVLIPYIVYTCVICLYYFTTADIQYATEAEFIREMGFRTPPKELFRNIIIPINHIFLLLNPLLIYYLGYLWIRGFSLGKISHKRLMSVMIHGELVYATGLLLYILPIRIIENSNFSVSAFAAISWIPGFENEMLTKALMFLLIKTELFFILELLFVGKGISILTGCSRLAGRCVSILSVGLYSILTLLLKLLL